MNVWSALLPREDDGDADQHPAAARGPGRVPGLSFLAGYVAEIVLHPPLHRCDKA